MRADFIEFFLGYARTEARVNSQRHVFPAHVPNAENGTFFRPTFPTLRQACRDGFDLRLDRPGCSILLQLKLCLGMTSRSPQGWTRYNSSLVFPFLRLTPGDQTIPPR